MAPAILALTGGAVSVLGTKTITYNGEFPASDDNLDGYSSVTVSRQPNLHPIASNLSNGWVSGGVFYVGNGGQIYDLYEVEAGHTYLFEYDDANSNQRLMFSVYNTALATADVYGTEISISSGTHQSGKWKATSNGYVTFTRASAPTYAFDITLTEDL